MTKQSLATVALTVALVACIAGAVGTATWTVRFGLFAQREPLPVWHTAIRVGVVLCAAVLIAFRRDRLERVALVCAVIAAGASAVFGLGVRSPSLFAIRLIFHFLAYALGGVTIGRLLLRTHSGVRSQRG